MSYTVDIVLGNNGLTAGNGMRFQTEGEAERYIIQRLRKRFSPRCGYRIRESKWPANYEFPEGASRPSPRLNEVTE